MKTIFEDLSMELKAKNIRLSHQRLMVLDYIDKNRCHPTVDQIHSDLVKDMPTLSKTTIYNTLNALIDVGLVRRITIEDNETRYDITSDDHGHFKCESCGKIFDFHINMDSIQSDDLDDFKIKNKDIYFKGICPLCSAKGNN